MINTFQIDLFRGATLPTKAVIALLMIAIVLASFSVSISHVRSDDSNEPIAVNVAFQLIESGATYYLPEIPGDFVGAAIEVFLNAPLGGWTASVSVSGGTTVDAGTPVTIPITFNTGDDCGGQLNVQVLAFSPDGLATTALENIFVTGPPPIPCDQEVGINFMVTPYTDLAVVGQIPSDQVSSSTNIWVNGAQYAQNTNTICCTQASPSFAGGSYISPTTIAAGGSITAYFFITNPNSFPIQVGLGMSITPTGANNWISDPYNDVVITISPGTNVYSRSFDVPSYAAAGSYDLTLAIWSGPPGSSNQYDSTEMPGGLTVISY